MHGSLLLSVLVLLAVSLTANTAPAPHPLYGVSPEDTHVYSQDHFQCTASDGSPLSLPKVFINNDYCDCSDGSDEPGTSACAGRPRAVFYCSNTGSMPLRMSASRVNDGICDCCDGTDEYDGRTHCPNTCAEQGAAERRELQQRRKTVAAGLAKRNQYAAEGRRRKQTVREDLEGVREQLKTARRELEKLEAEKVRMDRLEGLEQKEAELSDDGKETETEGSTEEHPEEGSDDVPTDPEAEKIRDQYEKAKDKVRDLERKEKDLNDSKKKDWGPDARFAALDGKCFTIDTNEYVYEMCPYGKAAQKPKRGANVNLGTFERFSNNYRRMEFKGGSSCWNGPKRSLGVVLECGSTEQVLHILEPSMCVYEMRFATPAACEREQLDDIDAQLSKYYDGRQ